MAGPYSLSGSGTQTLAQPGALLVTITAFPTQGRNGRGTPTNYFDVAILTPGDANGWYDVIPVKLTPQVIPLQPGMTRLGYTCLQGATLNVQELNPTVPNNQLQPWDRNPQVHTLNAFNNTNGGDADTAAVSYVVPSGKLYWVSHLEVSVTRRIAPTTRNNIQAYWVVDGFTAIMNFFVSDTVDQFMTDGLRGGVLIIEPGGSLQGRYSNADSGGQAWVEHLATGFLFDA